MQLHSKAPRQALRLTMRSTCEAAPPPPLQACNRQTVYCVPLYDSLGDSTVQYILDHSGGVVGGGGGGSARRRWLASLEGAP